MKKALLLVSIIGLFAFGIVQDMEEQKKFKVEFTDQEWDIRLKQLNYVKERLQQSDLPAKDVKLINDSIITKFQTEMVNQLMPQIAAARDTTKKKK